MTHTLKNNIDDHWGKKKEKVQCLTGRLLPSQFLHLKEKVVQPHCSCNLHEVGETLSAGLDVTNVNLNNEGSDGCDCCNYICTSCSLTFDSIYYLARFYLNSSNTLTKIYTC